MNGSAVHRSTANPSETPGHPVWHRAPWSAVQKAVSVFVIALLSGVGLGVLPSVPDSVSRGLAALFLSLVASLGMLSMVRGYRVSGDEVRVRRLFWDTRIPLRGLQSVESDPKATRGSVRLFGNGGFLSSTGWYWNRRLGRYRLFANDASRAVVMRFPDRRVVLAPEDPDRFVCEVRERAGCPAPGRS